MIAFSIWTINIYRYGIFYAISFLLWYIFLKYQLSRRIPKQYTNLKKILTNETETLLLYIILWVLIWGRLGHVFIYDLQYYVTNPLEVLEIRKWGMSFIWWIIGVSLSMLIFKQKYNITNRELLFLFDWVLTITPIGIALGRIWNFLNQELYWIPVPECLLSYTSISSFLQKINVFYVYDKIDNILRINTNLISSVLEWLILFIFTLLIFYCKKEKRAWYISSFFLIYYSSIRFLLEYIRYDSQSEFILIFTKSQRFFLAFIVLWITIFRKISISNNHTS